MGGIGPLTPRASAPMSTPAPQDQSQNHLPWVPCRGAPSPLGASPTLKLPPPPRQLFFNGTEPLRPQDPLLWPALASTLETVAAEGAEALYTGRLSQLLLDDIAREGQYAEVPLPHKEGLCAGTESGASPGSKVGPAAPRAWEGHAPVLPTAGWPQTLCGQSPQGAGPGERVIGGFSGFQAWSWPPSQLFRGRLASLHPSPAISGLCPPILRSCHPCPQPTFWF